MKILSTSLIYLSEPDEDHWAPGRLKINVNSSEIDAIAFEPQYYAYLCRFELIFVVKNVEFCRG